MPRPNSTATDTVADAHIADAPGRPTGGRRGILLNGLLVLVPLLTAPALAEPTFEGRFKGRGEGALDLQVFALGADKPGEHLVIAETAIPNACTGEVRGVARRQGPGVLRLRKATDEPGQFCEITLRYGPDGKRVAMSAEGCGDFHGTACDFVGTLTRR